MCVCVVFFLLSRWGLGIWNGNCLACMFSASIDLPSNWRMEKCGCRYKICSGGRPYNSPIIIIVIILWLFMAALPHKLRPFTWSFYLNAIWNVQRHRRHIPHYFQFCVIFYFVFFFILFVHFIPFLFRVCLKWARATSTSSIKRMLWSLSRASSTESMLFCLVWYVQMREREKNR